MISPFSEFRTDATFWYRTAGGGRRHRSTGVRIHPRTYAFLFGVSSFLSPEKVIQYATGFLTLATAEKMNLFGLLA
jgi:hypothetical protein